VSTEESYRLVPIDELKEVLHSGDAEEILTTENLYSFNEWLQRCQELASELLLSRMKELCVKYCHQAWVQGFEFSLWRAIIEGPVKIQESEITELDRLCSDAGGWWTWAEGEAEPLFLALPEWRNQYDQQDEPQPDLQAENLELKERIQRLEEQLQKSDST